MKLVILHTYILMYSVGAMNNNYFNINNKYNKYNINIDNKKSICQIITDFQNLIVSY